ncbi:hypothetical protein BUALT_Bualt18G0127100 [Buddleja alternifolia]|uniref:Uncharacterized protein n=1 Tax=Buddleja alternifolia TaxID=168488 RepID=A0AAV6WF49_9LAMI|nr:hypothetical protein BUALT_Bualt18G0127100 [Buddleja alternifolia]
MDESWRMRIGMPTPKLPNYPPRRSTEDTTAHRRNAVADDTITPEDFADVFGGPPRTVLSRQFSTNNSFSRSSSSTAFSYEDMFRQPEKKAPATGRGGRSLPQFSIPAEKQKSNDLNLRNRQINGFYSDIFGWDDERVMRSRSRSKTSSSSVLSSEELSPLRPTVSDDGDDVFLFASKLRPINVRSRWNPPRTVHEDHHQQQNTTPFTVYNHTENDYLKNLRNSCVELSRKNASPETINLEPISSSSFRVSSDDLHLNSPSSAVSSLSDHKPHEIDFEILRPQDAVEQDQEDEIMSSYVIEINPENTCESNGVDEAIAWAKERFQRKCLEEEKSTDDLSMLNMNQIAEEHMNSFESTLEQQDKCAAEEETSKIQKEMQILNEQIRLWSSGKESDIRLLLSSLHNILWPNSGWSAISLMNMIESSQVKKAYQKARLCLHPDKLQQRGATVTQKYIAEMVFSVLADAWAGFISHEVF